MDVDGVVTPTAIQELFNRRGVSITLEDAAIQPGSYGDAHQSQLRNWLGGVVKNTAAKWEAAKGAAPTEWDLEAMFKEMPQAVSDQMKKAPAHPAAVEVVSGLVAQGVKIGAATEFEEKENQCWVKHAMSEGIHIDSSGSASGAGIGDQKGAPPLPWRAITLAANMGLYPMNSCIRVTSQSWGVEEGINAGMWTVAVSNSAKSFDCAHYVIESVSDLPAVVEEISLRMRMGDRP